MFECSVHLLYSLLSDHQHSRYGASGASEVLSILADVLMQVASNLMKKYLEFVISIKYRLGLFLG